MKTRAIQKRFEEARELAMAAKFRPERLKTEMKEEEIDERGKGVVFGEFDETDEKHVKELEKARRRDGRRGEFTASMAADGCTGAIYSGK